MRVCDVMMERTTSDMTCVIVLLSYKKINVKLFEIGEVELGEEEWNNIRVFFQSTAKVYFDILLISSPHAYNVAISKCTK